MRPVPRRFVEVGAGAAFFVSGACALCFERLWFERAGLAFGNDVWASSTVLSAFMLGLAGGHALASRFPERLRTLRAFAMLELVAAVCGAGLVVFFGVVESHFANITANAFERPWLIGASRLLMAFALFLVPSTAMGASLPALTGALSRSSNDFGRVLGYLYGANTAGGVLGVAFTEQWLVPRLGVRATALAAGTAQLVVGLLALVAAPLLAAPAAAVDEPRGSGRRPARWLVCAALSGFCLLGLEVVWVRVLTLFVDDTSSAFASILAVVLFGIALGGIAGGVWSSRTGAVAEGTARTAYLCGAAGLAGYLAYPSLLERLYVPEASPGRVALIAAPLVVPVAVCSGVLFTLIGVNIRRAVGDGAAATGSLGAANTLGAALGSSVAGFLLLPVLGMERALFVLLAVYGVIGLAASAWGDAPRVWPIPSARGRLPLNASRRGWGPVGCHDPSTLGEQITINHGEASETTGEPGAGSLQQQESPGAAQWSGGEPKPPGPDRSISALQDGRSFSKRESTRAPRIARWVEPCAFVAFMALFPFGKVRASFIEASAGRWLRGGDRIVETRETPTATLVHVRHQLGSVPVSDQVLTNAYSMAANDFFARRYMKFFVYLPVALQPRIESTLVLGYGMGNTAAALVDTKELRRIDVVDTSREMLDLSRGIAARVGRSPLEDPRVRIHIADARYFLRSTSEAYDLITGEPPPPSMARVASLYTREYFSLIRDRLSPSGMVTYWLPTMNLGAPAVRSIVRAFCAVFADCSLWNGAAENFVLAGSRGAHTTVTDDRLFAQWRDPQVSAELRDVGFEFPGQIGAAFIGDSSYLTELTRDAEPLTDDFPKRVSVTGSREDRARLLAEWRSTRAAADRFRNSPFVREWFSQAGRRQTLQHLENQRLLNDLLFPGPTRARQVAVLDQVLWDTPLRLPALLLLGSDPDAQRALAAVPPETRTAPPFRVHELARALVARDPTTAFDIARKMPDAEMPLPGLRSYVQNAVIHAHDGDIVLP